MSSIKFSLKNGSRSTKNSAFWGQKPFSIIVRKHKTFYLSSKTCRPTGIDVTVPLIFKLLHCLIWLYLLVDPYNKKGKKLSIWLSICIEKYH
jgi:hypothetical protein